MAFAAALAVPATLTAQGAASLDCPLQGDTRAGPVQAINRLKNRMTQPSATDFDTTVTLAALSAPGDDRRRFTMRKAARIVGYVADIKVGGLESVNCHARDAADRDSHIELTLDPNDPDEARHVLVEVTPRWRALMAKRGIDWNTAALRRAFLGRWIEVTGWLLYDMEHEANAANTHRGNARVWRATAWEIHPITSMRAVPAPRSARKPG